MSSARISFLLLLYFYSQNGSSFPQKETNFYNQWENVGNQKNGHHYSAKNSAPLRTKRGIIAAALLTGVIGGSLKAVDLIPDSQKLEASKGGCDWFGTAPLCNYPCPSGYDTIRTHNGRCGNYLFADICIPDPAFGKPCIPYMFKKHYCCKSDVSDCQWNGRWMSANNSYNYYCQYHPPSVSGNELYEEAKSCGTISCEVNHLEYKSSSASNITGPNCKRVDSLWGMKGQANCGLIKWFGPVGEQGPNDFQLNSWYKAGN